MGKYKKDKNYDSIIKNRLVFIELMARDGLTDKQIAANLGISARTLITWKSEHPELGEAIRDGRSHIIRHVEHKLLELIDGATDSTVVEVEERPIIENGEKA